MIPRVIHQVWLGSPIPDHLARMTRTWTEHHPGWGYHLWTEPDVSALGLTHRDLYDAAERIVPTDAVWQFRSDLVRWDILHRHGGVYADTDTTCQRPLDGLLAGHSMVAGWEMQSRWVGVSVLASVPGHPVAGEVLAAIPGIVAAAPVGTRPNRLTGPKALSPLLRRRDDVHLLDEHVLYPVQWDDPLRADRETFPDSHVVHHFQHQRDLRGLACG